MSIPVKIINQSIHPLPAYATPDAAGMDLRANISDAISTATIRTSVNTYRYFY